MTMTYDEGRAAAQEDYAIGACFGVPDETLGEHYRNGYVQGWNQCAAMSVALDLGDDGPVTSVDPPKETRQ